MRSRPKPLAGHVRALNARRAAAAGAFVAVALTLALFVPASARRPGLGAHLGSPTARPGTAVPAARARARADTLWIFDADFEDMAMPNNQGWVSLDRSGIPPSVNHWHKDTIRLTEPYLGDSTWWCGTVDTTGCWRQPRGYGNYWICYLVRDFPLPEWSAPADDVAFEWDQRYALERNYDYGYLDVSADGGSTWSTVRTFNNGGFQGPGTPHNWNHPVDGHYWWNMSDYAGTDVSLRFRVETDGAYSSADQYDNPQHSVLDGAWQLDNFEWTVNGETVWFDDCESPGDNGWRHDDITGIDQTGVTFRRVHDPETLRGFTCHSRSGWMMAAIDSVTGRMVDGQQSWLRSPVIDISGAEDVVAVWNVWFDLPEESHDWCYRVHTYYAIDPQCVWEFAYCPTSTYNAQRGGPEWRTWTKDLWGPGAGESAWLAMQIGVGNKAPAPPEAHFGGLFLDRFRLGETVEDESTRWCWELNALAHDWFSTSHADDPMIVYVEDLNGLDNERVVASDDGGVTWVEGYAHINHNVSIGCGDQFSGYLPGELTAPGTTIIYYFECTDGLGNVATLPENAPGQCFEVSFLPIHASVEEPGILLVDKSRALIPGDDRSYAYRGRRLVQDALDILGYEYDTYVSGSPGPPHADSLGPQQALGYDAYDTHIWIAGNLGSSTLKAEDQERLIDWLSTSTPGSPKNLLVCGNEIAWELMEEGAEWGGFFTDWVGASYEGRHPGACPHVELPDTLIRVRDVGLMLMAYDDRECWLQCACPELQCMNVVGPSATGGAVQALEYENEHGEVYPAGVVKVDSLLGYRVVFLPFGIEYMNDGLDGVSGHYRNGVADRVDLLRNIMEFFEEAPTGAPTSAPDGPAFVTRLGRVCPNPFNPVATIEYSMAARAHVALRVYDLAGRLARTLVDGERDRGEHRAIWDGATDSGDRAASGVYFVRMETGGYRAVDKLVLLK